MCPDHILSYHEEVIWNSPFVCSVEDQFGEIQTPGILEAYEGGSI